MSNMFSLCLLSFGDRIRYAGAYLPTNIFRNSNKKKTIIKNVIIVLILIIIIITLEGVSFFIRVHS